MQGAREYAKLFGTKQYGKLYIVSSGHARGNTFHVYILPDGEDVKYNSSYHPLNKDAVCVYGVTGGNPGWTETYGWLHKGAWVNDFDDLVASKRTELEDKKRREEVDTIEANKAKRAKIKELLSKYQ